MSVEANIDTDITIIDRFEVRTDPRFLHHFLRKSSNLTDSVRGSLLTRDSVHAFTQMKGIPNF